MSLRTIKKGDYVEIIGNSSCHYFVIGEIVLVTKIHPSLNYCYCNNSNKSTQWAVNYKDIKKAPNKKANEMKSININLENLTQDEKDILMGLAEKGNKKSKVWKPIEGEHCWMLNPINQAICTIPPLYNSAIKNIQYENGYDIPYNLGFIKRTRAECALIVEKMKIQKELQDFALENNDGELNWNDSSVQKYFLYYQYYLQRILVHYQFEALHNNTVYFTSLKIAEQAMNKIGVERLKKYYFEVE